MMKKLITLALLFSGSQALAELPPFNLDLSQTTVSGLSSGGYMATQMQIAHSDWIQGAGIVAAGPYYCAQNSLLTALGSCINKRSGDDDLQVIQAQLVQWEKAGKVAPLGNLQERKIWLLQGTKDEKIVGPVGDALHSQLKGLIKNDNLHYVQDKPFAHHMPTLDSGTDCGTSAAPFLGNCQYDGAGEMLSHLLDKVKPKATSVTGKVLEFSQQALGGENAEGLADTGYLYAPEQCLKGEACQLHISFHGCNQNAEAVGKAYVENAGFNAWADTNNLVVLYPQTKASAMLPMNPQACWDWWGYTNEYYATQEGVQIKAVTQMAKSLAGKTS